MLDLVRPRVCSVPAAVSSAGREAVDLARMAGLDLDDWQQFVLEQALGEREDGRWAAFEVAVVVSRQNGKGAILEARELAGLFLLDEKLIIHSAHQFDTSLEAFRRLLALIEGTPDLVRRVKRVSRAHGEEGIELVTGQRIRFRTRTKGGGRGFSGDCLILDEAMIIPESSHGALMPTLSARPNPQVWYAGSAVDQNVHDHGIVLARIRERGLRGDDPALAYFEWSVDRRMDGDDLPYTPLRVAPDVALDEEAWREANPALGIRISTEHVAREQRSMDPRTFAVERLGVGDWPATEETPSVIDPKAWRALADGASQVLDPVAFAFDVSPDRDSASICAAGRRDDGLLHLEVVDRRRGTGWLVPRMAELVERHGPSAVLCDGIGPGASLVRELEQSGVSVRTLAMTEYVQACGAMFDLVDQARLRHLGTPELDAAVKSSAKRPLGDAWAWSRKNSGADITPLVAATLALWAHAEATTPFLI